MDHLSWLTAVSALVAGVVACLAMVVWWILHP